VKRSNPLPFAAQRVLKNRQHSLITGDCHGLRPRSDERFCRGWFATEYDLPNVSTTPNSKKLALYLGLF